MTGLRHFASVALLALSASTSAFQLQITKNSIPRSSPLRAAAPTGGSGGDNDKHFGVALPPPLYVSSATGEISRRAAVVSAAMLAATRVSPAVAQDLSETVAALYADNKDTANTNGAPEKHVPAASVSPEPRTGKAKRVEVTVPHVMDPAKPHFIEYVWLAEAKTGEVVVAKKFEATDDAPPTLVCVAPNAVKLIPYCWCNLHGLWKGEKFVV